MIGICKVCNQEKQLQHYQNGSGRTYYRKMCVACWSDHRKPYQSKYRYENVVELSAYHKTKHERKKSDRNAAHRRHYRNLQKVVFDHYGAKCACCGENESAFLSIDHKNNDGAEHRKKIGVGHILFRWIIDNAFPSTLQLLCCNCNIGKHRNGGVCPHEEKRLKYRSPEDRHAI